METYNICDFFIANLLVLTSAGDSLPDELLLALSNSSDFAVGPDDIHYQILKHLPTKALHTLLNTLNDIWLTGNFQVTWQR